MLLWVVGFVATPWPEGRGESRAWEAMANNLMMIGRTGTLHPLAGHPAAPRGARGSQRLAAWSARKG